MASSISESVQIFFLGEDSSLSNTLNSIDSNLSNLENNLDSISQPAANLTKDLLKIELAAATAAAALTALSINEAGKFKDGIGSLGALFSGTDEQIDSLSESLKSFAKNSSASLQEIQNASFIAISTGTDQAKVTESLAVAQKLAVAGSSDLVTATSTLSRALNAYGEDADKAEEFSSALFLAAQQGDTNFTALGQALGGVSGTASAANVPIDVLLSGLTSLTIETGQTSESVTKMRSVISELADPSKELSSALGGLRLDTDGLGAVMDRLQQVTGGTQEEMSKLFGSSEATAAALILSNDAAGKFNGTLDLMKDRVGIVDTEYQKLSGSFENTNQKLANNFKVALIEIGTPLLEEYTSIANAVSEIFNGLGLSVKNGGLKVLTDTIESFGKNAAKSLEGIAQALPDALNLLNFDNLLNSLDKLGLGIGNVFDDIFGSNLDLSKPEDLAKALQRGVDIASSLIDVTRGILIQFQPIFELISRAADEVGEADSGIAVKVGELLGALTILADFGIKIGGAIVVLNNAGASMSEVFDTIRAIVITFALGVESSFLALEGLFTAVVQRLFEALALISGAFDDDISAGFTEQANILSARSRAITKDLEDNATASADAWKKIGEESEKTAEKTKDSSLKIKESVKDFTERSKSDIEAFNSAFNKNFTTIGEDAAKLADELNNTDFNIETKFSSSEFDKFNSKIKELTKAGVEFSSVWDEDLGGTITQFGVNVSNTSDSVSDSFKNLQQSINPVITTLEDFNKNPASLKFDNEGDFNEAFNQLTKLGAQIKGTFKDGQFLITNTAKSVRNLGDDSLSTANEIEKTSKAFEDLKKENTSLTESQKITIDKTFELKNTLLELASDERIKQIEFNTAIKTTELETGARRVEALFNSISSVVDSTSVATADMFDTLAAAFGDSNISSFDQSSLTKRFDKQIELQERAIVTQEKAVDSEIALNEARTESLLNGTEITINNIESLEPFTRELILGAFRLLEDAAITGGFSVLQQAQ